MSATSGVCLVRVEVQSHGLLLTVITDRHGRQGLPGIQHFTEIDRALAVVRDFLAGFRKGELPSPLR
jgi:hypothetical protein